MVQACLPALRENKGRIINIGSVAGYFALDYMSAYAASKHAMEAVSDSLRREVGMFGVSVSLIEPGAVLSSIHDKVVKNNDEALTRVGRNDSAHAAYYSRMKKRMEIEHFITSRESFLYPHPRDSSSIAIEHAMLSSRPYVRYPLGYDAYLALIASRYLPTTLVDIIMLISG
jgi:short-subunit dehydrogenase